ncbi:MAG: DUF2061 domain-containing protein [Hyphomicrobiales bacterium]
MIDVISERAFDSHSRSVAKAITWRTLGSIDTFVLSWIITGNFVSAGSIASFEVITKMTLYYLHERGWSHVKWGQVPAIRGAGQRAPARARDTAAAITQTR